MRAVVLRLAYRGWPVLVRVEHAALVVGDVVEVAGRQLARDGTPQGQVWLAVDVRELPAAVVGYVEVPQRSDVESVVRGGVARW